MKNSIRQDRAHLRQRIVDSWFAKFVDCELYNKEQYHDFCKRVKGKTEFEIERIFRLESRV